MNIGTKIRTVLAFIMLVNEALIRIGTVDFGDDTSNLIYRWVSFFFLVAAYVASHWFNNDYTIEACIGTGVTRQLKAESDDDYVGDFFFEDFEPDDDEEVLYFDEETALEGMDNE